MSKMPMGIGQYPELLAGDIKNLTLIGNNPQPQTIKFVKTEY